MLKDDVPVAYQLQDVAFDTFADMPVVGAQQGFEYFGQIGLLTNKSGSIGALLDDLKYKFKEISEPLQILWRLMLVFYTEIVGDTSLTLKNGTVVAIDEIDYEMDMDDSEHMQILVNMMRAYLEVLTDKQ